MFYPPLSLRVQAQLKYHADGYFGKHAGSLLIFLITFSQDFVFQPGCAQPVASLHC